MNKPPISRDFMNQLAQHVMTNTDFMNQLFASYASTNSTSANVSQSNGVNFKPPKPDKFVGEMRLVESHLFELRAYLSFCREFSSDVAKITASATFLKDRAAIVMIIRRQHIYITILRIKILYLEA